MDARAAQSATDAQKGQRFAALRSRNFRLLWVGAVVANVGGQMQPAALGWLVRDLHPEPFYLGLLSLSFAIPMLLLTPIGGAVADRVPRLTLVKLTKTGMLVQAAILAALSLGGWLQLWHMLLLTFVYAIMLAADNPGRQALLPDLVPREDMTSAVSLFAVAWTGAGLFGPALAGLLLGSLGAGGVFSVNAVSFVAVLAGLFMIRGLPPDPPPRPGSLGSGLAGGAKYVVRDRPTALLLSLLSCGNVLGRSYIFLMPIFARDVLGVGPEAYGLLYSAPAAGALVGGFGLAGARKVRTESVAVVGWFGFATALVVFTVSRNFAFSLLALLLVGAFSTLFNASVSTMLQLRSPRDLRGRVMSLNATSNIGGSHLGGMLSASVATYLGAPLAVAGGGLVLLALGAGVTIRRGWRLVSSPPAAHASDDQR